MSANDFLTLLIQLIFVLIAFVTTLDYIRRKDKTRRDIALMFGSLTASYVAQALQNVIGTPSPIITSLGTVAIIAQPYLMLRLVQYFRPVPARLMRIAGLAMVMLWVGLALLESFSKVVQAIVVVVFIANFVIFDGYAMVSFVRGAITTSGVVRQRLRFAAAGSGLFALTLLTIGLALIPPLRDLVIFLVLLSAAGSALSFYIGFAPPRWLRRAWQMNELRHYLRRVAEKPLGGPMSVTEGLEELCRSANLAVGGMVTAIAQEDETQKRWMLRFISDRPELTNSAQESDGIIRRVAREHTPTAIRISSAMNESDRHLLETVGADTLLIAPVVTIERVWVLLVFQKHTSLFLDDDLDLLTLLVQQGAVFLENGLLIETLHQYSHELENRVVERTQELQESQIQYRRIIETSQEGIWLTSADNRTLFANARMAEILGCTVEEMMPVSTLDFVDEDQIAVVREARVRRSQGVKEQYELRFRRRDGASIYTLVAATPLADDDGKTIGSLAMVADITERKRAEDEIHQLNADLEQRVTERTAELSVANRELEAFSYSVSHDLRAPLRAMDGFAQAVLEDYGDRLEDDGRNFLERIRAASQRMGLLIDAMLQLSRLSRTEMQVKQVNLSKLAQSIQQDLCEQFPTRKVEFVIADGIEVKGDEGLLRIAMTNLMNNASKFSSKQPNARVEFGKVQHNGSQAYFVRDNGVGFDMEHAQNLFGAFQRLHSSSEFEGTGIGLATVERIVRRHKGKIWVEAAVNQGATFYFVI